MPKVWSINTTVRNPERLQDFLKILKEFEGQNFDNKTQSLYQKALVKNKLYKPLNIPEDLKKEYENPGNFNDEDTEIIFSYINDPDLRGRTSASRCNQMGLAIALKSEGPVVITNLGNKFLNNDFYDDENFFFKYFIKWQLPNPLETGYNDFNINPFLSTLYIINKVNDLEEKRGNKRKGISKNEFALFVIPLKNVNEIDSVCNQIISFRDLSKKSEDKHEFFREELKKKVLNIYGELSKKDIDKKANNLEDYADSAIRWFRKTTYIMYRGAKRYVDISPSRLEQSKQLINNLTLGSENYKNKNDYRKYLSDENSPNLPWDTDIFTKKAIILDLGKLIKNIQNKIDTDFPNKRIHNFEFEPIFTVNMTLNDYKKLEKTYRKHYEIINNELMTLRESNLKNLDKYINKLMELTTLNRNKSKNKAPLCLEWYTSLSLMAIDDSIEIKPNIIKSDDGLPLFTAAGGVPDIECYYETFNLMVEVTLIKSKQQVFNEVLPICRHFADMQIKNSDKKCYCLFIAPIIHRDALNQFYYYINNGFEGCDLNLIPLTIKQYSNFLKIILNNSNKNKMFNHNNFEKFLNNTLKCLKNENNSKKWQDIISNSIEKIKV